MAEFDTETVRKIAHLARLGIPADALPHYREDLSHILDVVDKISSVDTTGIQPMAHPFDMTQQLRVDQVTETDNRAALLQNAPEQTDQLFLVPKVIE